MQATDVAAHAWKVNLKAGEGKNVPLGLYEPSLGEPKFQITFEPDVGDDVKYQLRSTPDGEELSYSYYFQNWSGRSCIVTIREKDV